LKGISILGYKDGTVCISVFCPRELLQTVSGMAQREKYFNLYGLNIRGYFLTKGHEQLKAMFRLISENNELPGEWLPLIRDLVEKGNWTLVTPLKEGKSLSEAPPIRTDEVANLPIPERFPDIFPEKTSHKRSKSI
jgi:hypothetical protein